MNIQEIIVDNFAGGGGASTGIEMALGRPVDAAINHDPLCVALHKANHPATKHYCEDVFKVDPTEVAAGRKVGLAWFSPDCKHFSKAKGGKPRSKKIRGLAWVVTKWAANALARPRVIFLENVEEFQDWGPLLASGHPCPDRKGRTFKSFIKRLRNLGYEVEWKELRACDYGAPTIRKRLYLIARCDGQPIVWPTPSHGDPKSDLLRAGMLKPWRTAAECIDFSLPCYSIFLTKKQARKYKVKRPLAKATMARLAKGTFKFVINAQEPFIVPVTHQGSDSVESCSEPFRVITGAHRGEKALAVPFLTEHANGSKQRVFAINAALRTQCAEVKGGHFAMAMPFISRYNSSHDGRQDGDARNQNAADPLTTQDTSNRFALVSAFLAKFKFDSDGAAAAVPMPTVTAGSFIKRPGGAGHAMGLVASHLTKFYGTTTGQPTDTPMHSTTAQGNHIAEVRAFLIKYYGNEKDGISCGDPIHTIPTVDRFGLVTVEGQDYQISDICLRMLVARELYAAQGFPGDYQIQIMVDVERRGKKLSVKLSGEAQVRMAGNSVCPPVAAALVAANVPEMKV